MCRREFCRDKETGNKKMKCTKVILGGLIAGVAMVNAMPTLEQTKKVEPLVMDLMREDQNAARPEQVREMWHFVCSRTGGDTWKLDGIDQLS